MVRLHLESVSSDKAGIVSHKGIQMDLNVTSQLNRCAEAHM